MPQLPSDDELRRRVEALREQSARGELELLGLPGGGPVELASADPAWADRFDEIRRRLHDALRSVAVRIEYVG